MTSNINWGELVSTGVRSSIGVRNFKARLQRKSADAQGIIQWIWNGADQLGGWILEQAFKLAGGTITGVLQLIFGFKNFVWNFNFNATDDEINQQVNQRYQAILTRLGGATGKSLGYVVGATATTAGIAVFNEALAANALKDAIPELMDELMVEWSAVAQLTAQSLLQNLALGGFKNTRNFIKWYAEFYRGYIPENISNGIAKWGSPGSKPWSFAQAVEDSIESIPIEWLRQPLQELIEEFGEGVEEASYVIAAGADALIAQQKLANSVASPLGEMKYIEVMPNRSNPEERYILAGDEELIQQEITGIIANSQVIAEKDVGLVYANNPYQHLAERRFKPQLLLKFMETREDMYARQDVRQIEGEISLRLMKWETETITKEYLTTLATAIKSKFGLPRYIWQKGSIHYTYEDERNGAQFRLFVDNESMARALIENTLDLINVSPDWELLKLGSKNVIPKSTTTGEKITILGEVVEQPIRGKKGKVKFLSAEVSLYGKNNRTIHLYHAYGRWRDAYVT